MCCLACESIVECLLQLTKARSQSTVLTSYRDLVRKGQDQFSKELEQNVPGVKIGESTFSLLAWAQFALSNQKDTLNDSFCT